MADLQSETFNATTAPAGVTDFTANGGTIDDTSTSTCTLSCTTTAGSKSRRRMPTVNMAADGDTLSFKVASASSFVTMIVLRQDTGSTAFQPMILAAGANWTAQRFRDSTGYGALAGTTTTRAIASYPWLRFRRVSSTQIACEASPDATPGSWVSIATADQTADALTLSMSTTQLELMAYDPDGGFSGSTVIDQVGDGSGSTSAGALFQHHYA